MKNKYIILLLGVLFLQQAHNLILFEGYGEVNLFLFADVKQVIEWYIYDSCQIISMIILCFLLYKTTKYRTLKELSLMITIFSIVDLINYWLTYGDYEYYIFFVVLIIYCISRLKKICKIKDI